MADTLDTVAKPTGTLLVQGRNPFADETITISDPSIISTTSVDNGDGTVTVTVTGLVDGLSTITVDPGAEDAGFSAGSDDITVTTTVPPTPLTVTLA